MTKTTAQIAIAIITATLAVSIGDQVWVLGHLIFVVGDDRVVIINTEVDASFWCWTMDEILEDDSESLRDLAYTAHAASANVAASTARATLETEYPWHVAAENEDIWVTDGHFCQS